jgi:hypothetical protein
VTSTENICAEFLKFCPPVPPDILKLLRGWGIDAATAEQFSLRFSFRGYRTALTKLGQQFGRQAMLESGLIRTATVPAENAEGGPTGETKTMIFGTFEAYRHARVPYLIVPYLVHGKPVYLKARALLDNSDLKARKLPESLSTAPHPPGFYNIDSVAGVERVLILKRELDAIAATRNAMTAVACAKLKEICPEWAEPLAGKHVVLVLDDRWKQDPNLGQAKRILEEAGIKSLRGISVSNSSRGMKLVKLLSAELDRKESYAPFGGDQIDLSSDSGTDLPALADEDAGGSGERNRSLLPSDSGLLSAELDAAESEEGIHRQFVATINVDPDKTLAIYVVERQGLEYIRCRSWESKAGKWQAKNLEFELPMKKAHHMIAAITAATQGRTLTEKPDWMQEAEAST